MQKNEKISVKIPFENAQNYMRLKNLLSSIALPLLRKTFINNWTAKYKSEWINCEGHGTKFIDDIGATLFKDARKIQKNLLKSGDIDKWDLSLVIDALKCFQEPAKANAKISCEKNKRFITLKEIRSQLSHHGGIEIDNELFEKMWKSASEVLISLGVPQGDLDNLLKIASMEENKANIEKALKLKDKGNLYVKNNNYVRAVETYSEAIYQPGLPSKEFATLCSNRSLAYLKLGYYYAAKEDAKVAILINPNWWRGFGRLGHAYLSVEKYKQAIENFEEALRLDADCKLQIERDRCRNMIAKISRDEYLKMLTTMTPKMTLDDSIGATSRKSLGLTDPYRVVLIKHHRAELSKMRYGNHIYCKGPSPDFLPKPVVDVFTLKPIHFADMDSTKDHIYEGFLIELTLIEDAITEKPSINQIAEDDNGDAQRICIYNFIKNKETQNLVGFGCKITILNPYFRLAKDGQPMIRVDDISLMFLHSNATNKKRCRYCGKENDLTVPCTKCKRSFYCSELCLKKDKIELNHKDVCLKRL